MSSSSSPLPYLPLEVKYDILRFCDPTTLAKTAQVSLAFLELSSPILYEDVHIHGFEGLKLLFSKRTQPPSLQTAPFLSLSQIRDLSIEYPLEDIKRDDYSDLGLDRAPSSSPLAVRTLRIILGKPQDDFYGSPPLSLPPLAEFLNPRRLIVDASRSIRASVFFDEAIFSSLETILLISADIGGASLGKTAERLGWNLRRVMFDLPGGDDDYLEVLMVSMLADLPLPELTEVVVLVESEEDKGEVLAMLRTDVEGRDSETRKKVLAQVGVEVKEHA